MMNICIVANHYPVCSARYMTDAFERAGHTVRHIGRAMDDCIWGIKVDPRHIWTPQDPTGFKPDLILVMDTDRSVYRWVYSFMWSPGTPVCVYTVDNHVRDVRDEMFDHYFVGHKRTSIMRWHGDMTWLPCAYDPAAFPPSPIPFDERPYDVALIGVIYEHRLPVLEALVRAGLKVYAGTGLLYDDYRDAYHHARVALSISACSDLPQRVFEGAAMGCAVIADFMPDLMELCNGHLVETGIHMGRDTNDIARLCVEAQHRPDWAAAAQTWARPHTWDARVSTIVDWTVNR